jgi:hypothetical protein
LNLPHGRHEWTGATAFVVGLFVSLGWAVAMGAAAFDSSVSDAGVQLLAGLGGVLTGAVAAYLGAGAVIRWRRIDDELDDE